ncbi:GntR family transcriptional regulator [Microvirga sp. VF16]|uniref:GntR family transcriptional regulator n=1 Tax=Microvirga sp. VF16 TaxID=2807101 RepID=UPI001FEEDA8E|nr:GntR family transcriptional regulator [Microvirga sp. VF16]
MRYLPSQRLSESALAEEFGVSRTPIRQVLQQLALFGLVESRNGVGTVVTEVNYERAMDLLAIRRHMALLMSETVDPSRFPRANRRMSELEKVAVARSHERDVQQYATIGLRIHKIILDTMSSAEYRRLWEECYYRTCRLTYSIVEHDWVSTNQLQLEEIRELVAVFDGGEPKQLASFCHRKLGEWMAFIQRMHAAQNTSRIDESFKELLHEFSAQN